MTSQKTEIGEDLYHLNFIWKNFEQNRKTFFSNVHHHHHNNNNNLYVDLLLQELHPASNTTPSYQGHPAQEESTIDVHMRLHFGEKVFDRMVEEKFDFRRYEKYPNE